MKEISYQWLVEIFLKLQSETGSDLEICKELTKEINQFFNEPV